MTATDTTTNKYWSGSDGAGPQDLTGYILHIMYDDGDTPVDNQTENVCVGMYIPVTAQYGPSDMALQWTVPGSIIYAYEADDNTGTIIPITPADMTFASLNYYWMDTDSGTTGNEKVTLTGSLPSGGAPSVSTTFNVYRPAATFTTSYPGPITLVNGELYDGSDPNGTGFGIEFACKAPPSPFGGTMNLWSAQIADSLVVKTEQYDASSNTTQEFAFGLPSTTLLPGPLLDTSFPYENSETINGVYYSDYWYTTVGGVTVLDIEDAPDYPVDPPPHGYGFGTGAWETYNVVLSESFVHNLLFLPSPPEGGVVTYAPLRQVGWEWSAEADNWDDEGFYLNDPNKTPATAPQSSDLSTLPEWNNNVTDPTWGWGNPYWQMVP